MGRGHHYSAARRATESVLRRLYRGDWPARVWGALPGRCRVAEVGLSIEAGGAKPLRIAFLSDLHLGPTTPSRLLDHAFEIATRARPDLLVLGGDYVFLDATADKAAELARRVDAVPAPTKVAVLGNHDLWTEHERLEDALRGVGVHVLVNDTLHLPAPHADAAIFGLDDPWTGDPHPERAAFGDARLRLCVCHAPEGLPLLRERVDLLLCGHTHGGQVALPGHRPVIVPGRQSRRWPHGLHHVDGTTLWVSRGVGSVELPVRTWAPPDVGVLDVSPTPGRSRQT